MNNISWRHHYLPVFYLKGFSKNGEDIKIFDVQKQRFSQNGKEFSAKSFFFEKNANTIITNDSKSDFLENSYREFDEKVSKLIKKINNSDFTNRHSISEDDMPVLNHFISLMYWRLPCNKAELENILQNSDLSTLGVIAQNADGTRNLEVEENIKYDTEFLKTFRFYNSLIDSIRGFNCRTPYSILDRHDAIPYLCSDNPVIFENESPLVFEDDYIFPLTGKRIFTKCNRRNDFPGYLWMLIDIVLLKQAVKYVSCTEEKYTEILENTFAKYNMTIAELKNEIFKRIK